MYRTLFYVNIYGSYKLSKNSPVFLAHPVHSEKSHTKNIMHFADRGYVRTWRNLCGYATVSVDLLSATINETVVNWSWQSLPYRTGVMRLWSREGDVERALTGACRGMKRACRVDERCSDGPDRTSVSGRPACYVDVRLIRVDCVVRIAFDGSLWCLRVSPRELALRTSNISDELAGSLSLETSYIASICPPCHTLVIWRVVRALTMKLYHAVCFRIMAAVVV